MKKYKHLIVLLVVFGSIHLILSAAIMPLLTKYFINHINITPFKTSSMLAALQYAYVIIWIPVAIWIYRDSKKEMFAPWLWAILMLIAHYQGLIIYLLIKIMTHKERNESPPNKDIETDAE